MRSSAGRARVAVVPPALPALLQGSLRDTCPHPELRSDDRSAYPWFGAAWDVVTPRKPRCPRRGACVRGPRSQPSLAADAEHLLVRQCADDALGSDPQRGLRAVAEHSDVQRGPDRIRPGGALRRARPRVDGAVDAGAGTSKSAAWTNSIRSALHVAMLSNGTKSPLWIGAKSIVSALSNQQVFCVCGKTWLGARASNTSPSTGATWLARRDDIPRGSEPRICAPIIRAEFGVRARVAEGALQQRGQCGRHDGDTRPTGAAAHASSPSTRARERVHGVAASAVRSEKARASAADAVARSP